MRTAGPIPRANTAARWAEVCLMSRRAVPKAHSTAVRSTKVLQ